MDVKLTCTFEAPTNKLLSIYYEIRDSDVARTVELDANCLLDVDDTNHPVGLELIGPFSLTKAKEMAAILCSPELDGLFMHIQGQGQLVRA